MGLKMTWIRFGYADHADNQDTSRRKISKGNKKPLAQAAEKVSNEAKLAQNSPGEKVLLGTPISWIGLDSVGTLLATQSLGQNLSAKRDYVNVGHRSKSFPGAGAAPSGEQVRIYLEKIRSIPAPLRRRRIIFCNPASGLHSKQQLPSLIDIQKTNEGGYTPGHGQQISAGSS